MTGEQTQMLQELRAIAASENPIPEEAFRRLVLAALADMYEHRHEKTEARLEALERRDLGVLLTSIAAALAAYVASLFHK